MICTWDYESPIGNMMMASDGTALRGLWFDGQKYFAENICDECAEKSLPIFDETIKWLDIYFSGEDPKFVPALRIETTPFRKAICEIMLDIPYGELTTYKEISDIVARQRGLEKMSAQAVGSAVAHNPISIIIPCQRVIGTSGSLTDYAGGIDKKIRLLELEKTSISNVFIPKK